MKSDLVGVRSDFEHFLLEFLAQVGQNLCCWLLDAVLVRSKLICIASCIAKLATLGATWGNPPVADCPGLVLQQFARTVGQLCSGPFMRTSISVLRKSVRPLQE